MRPELKRKLILYGIASIIVLVAILIASYYVSDYLSIKFEEGILVVLAMIGGLILIFLYARYELSHPRPRYRERYYDEPDEVDVYHHQGRMERRPDSGDVYSHISNSARQANRDAMSQHRRNQRYIDSQQERYDVFDNHGYLGKKRRR